MHISLKYWFQAAVGWVYFAQGLIKFQVSYLYLLKRGTTQNHPQPPRTIQNNSKPPTTSLNHFITTQNHLQGPTKTHNHIITTQNHPKYLKDQILHTDQLVRGKQYTLFLTQVCSIKNLLRFVKINSVIIR